MFIIVDNISVDMLIFCKSFPREREGAEYHSLLCTKKDKIFNNSIITNVIKGGEKTQYWHDSRWTILFFVLFFVFGKRIRWIDRYKWT